MHHTTHIYQPTHAHNLHAHKSTYTLTAYTLTSQTRGAHQDTHIHIPLRHNHVRAHTHTQTCARARARALRWPIDSTHRSHPATPTFPYAADRTRTQTHGLSAAVASASLRCACSYSRVAMQHVAGRPVSSGGLPHYTCSAGATVSWAVGNPSASPRLPQRPTLHASAHSRSSLALLPAPYADPHYTPPAVRLAVTQQACTWRCGSL